MKKSLSTMALAVALFAGAGCQKTELIAPVNSSDKNARISSTTTTTTPPVCDVISFSKASGIVSSVISDNGVMVDIKSHNPNFANQAEAAIIFNSSSPCPDGPACEDRDLGTPGFGNNANLGNIIVLHNFKYPTTIPNDDDVEKPGGYIEFIFPQPVTATSMQTIDVEAAEGEKGTVVLYDQANNVLASVAIPSTIPNGVATINLQNTPNVKRIVVNILGSMGFDNLAFCVPAQTNNCSYTQGYWKTHGPVPKGKNKNEWDVKSLMLGSVSYTDTQLLSIFNTPVKGNGLISLAHQLIAAKLNIANSSNPTTIASTITQADALIGSKIIPPVGDGYLSPAQVSSLVNTLTQYNEGTLPGGPKHCD